MERRLASFAKLKFGMFLHFNMATYRNAQWARDYADPSTFDPGGPIETDAWADAALAAGMTYGVLTTKHVGGFCLWDSKLTDYTVTHPDCPYPRDLVGQFVQSFTSRGLKAGLYYCWRHPGFDDPYKVLPPECDPAMHTLDQQIEFQKQQIAELIDMFPQVFYIWNDALDPDIMPAEDAAAFLHGLRDDLIVSGNWWDWSKKGEPYLDVAITETRHFPEGNTLPGETCWKLEGGWFWTDREHAVRDDDFVKQMNIAHSRGANFLLNVGPNRRGEIEPASVAKLAEIGRAVRG